MQPFRTLLIANRGEIARRIIRSARGAGLRTVAVHSSADIDAPHVHEADEAVLIGGAAPSESYLCIESILEAARRTGADAIHPGYGFLSERAAFAEAVRAAGLVFVGPPAEAIRLMGDKAAAKRAMLAAGVPCVPGYDGEDQSDAAFVKAAREIGYPIMAKASAGGGGRGMRRVYSESELPAALASARKEAEAAFGDGRLLLEKLVERARHIEVQVLADAHGNVVHLFERDCSVQRRHQKVIEEAPSPALSPDVRAQLCAAAVAAARACAYQNAGTVEFLYDAQTQAFHFIEMNTRLQVEHPVTELVTGRDLVALQLSVAMGEPLSFAQEDIAYSGHAIEARLYAEDPDAGFLPQTGEVALFRPAPGVRIDAGVEAGSAVSAHYDPMIAKVIAHGPTRDAARARLIAALEETKLLGLRTNKDWLGRILAHDAFASGDATTAFLDEAGDSLLHGARAPSLAERACAIAALIDAAPDALLTGWRSSGVQGFSVKLRAGEVVEDVRAALDRRMLSISVGEQSAAFEIVSKTNEETVLSAEGRRMRAACVRRGDAVHLDIGDGALTFEDVTYAPPETAEADAGAIIAPMAGLVTALAVAAGENVAKGAALLAIEAMKMEHKLTAPFAGKVADVRCAAGDQVRHRAVLIVIEPEEKA